MTLIGARAFRSAGRRCFATSILALVCLSSACASGHTTASRDESYARDAQFQHEMNEFVRSLAREVGAPPGFAVVAVHGENTVYEAAYGVRDLRTGAPMTLDTPIYNASVTKAYTGLLAAILDADAEVSLDDTLYDVWPDLVLTPPLDASRISARRLLSHTSGVSAGGLIFRSVVTGDVRGSDVPDHLARFARPTENPGFSYSNTGPYIYAAMAEAHTGVAWADLVRERVLEPWGLSRTMTRLEDIPADEVAHCNVRGRDGWQPVAHKPTVLMNAAGGMYASARDSARFLQMFISERGPAVGGVSAEVLRRTWTSAASRSQDIWGMHRDGYGLGWDLGDYGGRRFVSRSGGFSGCRAHLFFFPEHHFGIAVLSAGDAAVNMFNSAIVEQALDYWVGDPAATERAGQRRLEFSVSARQEDQRIRAEWAAFDRLTPIDGETQASMAGVYENERLGRVAFQMQGDEFVMIAGVQRFIVLRDSAGNLNLASAEDPVPDQFALVTDPRGLVVAIDWDDDRFDRVSSDG